MEKEPELNTFPHLEHVTFEVDFSPPVVMKYRARRGACFSLIMALLFVWLKLLFCEKNETVTPEEFIIIMRADSSDGIAPLVFKVPEGL